MTDQTKLAFVDTETTGLDPDLHQIWEVGLIVDEEPRRWFLPVDLGRADPIALRIGQFHERYPDTAVTGLATVAAFSAEFAALTRGRHLVGAVISFDEERLRRLLKANGACPEWHYHLIDVEALAVGFIVGRGLEYVAPTLPWDSSELSRSVGVDPDAFDKHTALGDALWAKGIYEAVTG